MKKATTAEKEHAADLISKYLLNSLSQSELTELQAWINQSPWNKAKFEELTNVDIFFNKLKAYIQELDRSSQSRIHKKNAKSQNWDLPAEEGLLSEIPKPVKLGLKAK